MSNLHHRSYLVESVMKVIFHFRRKVDLYDHPHHCLFSFFIDCTGMIGQVVILSTFHDKLHPIWSVIKVHFWFSHAQHLYDRSRHYPISSLSWTAHCPIGLGSSISYYIENKPIQLVTSLSHLVFMIDHILSDQSWNFSFDFGVDHTYIINHVFILSCLHHKLYHVGSIITIQFFFSTWSGLVRLATSLSFLIFIISHTGTIGYVFVLSVFRDTPHSVCHDSSILDFM